MDKSGEELTFEGWGGGARGRGARGRGDSLRYHPEFRCLTNTLFIDDVSAFLYGKRPQKEKQRSINGYVVFK
jgi:hypothetical protein